MTNLICEELHNLYLARRLGLLCQLHLFIEFLLELRRQLKRSIAFGMLADLHTCDLPGAFGDVTRYKFVEVRVSQIRHIRDARLIELFENLM